MNHRHCWTFKLLYLQEARQLAVAIGDVLVAIFVTQGVNAVAQRQEGTVDVSAFFQALTPILSLRDREKGE